MLPPLFGSAKNFVFRQADLNKNERHPCWVSFVAIFLFDNIYIYAQKRKKSCFAGLLSAGCAAEAFCFRRFFHHKIIYYNIIIEKIRAAVYNIFWNFMYRRKT